MSVSAPSLFDFTPLFPRLEVVDADDQRNIFLNGHLAGRYSCDDKGTERVLVTQLAEVLSLPDRQIAAAFNLHPVTVSRLLGLVREGGAAALLPSKPGPKGPSKMTPKLAVRCRSLRAGGASLRSIAKQVSTAAKKISYVTVANLFRAESAVPPPPQALPLATEASAVVEIASAPAASFGEGRSTRYAGAMLLFAALARLDLWGVFQGLGATTGPARRFGWAQTVAAIIFCFTLRFRSIEDWKNGRRQDLGVLIGEPSAPSVLSLRTKIKALAESVDPVAFSREMFKRYLALEPVWEGLYYVDGHFCSYYGEHPTPRGWDAKRGLAVKGHNDVYLHDAKGRALFFFSQPLNDSLGRAIPAAVAEIRRVHGQAPFTLVFDRGGYSGETFRFLQAEGIGFITYLKGRGAKRRYSAQKFKTGWFAFEGQRHTYQLFEKKTRVREVGLIRTVLFVGDDGHQIPVLTNLAATAKPAKVVHCLRLRWRQENSFKFLSENYAIDQIIQYGADPETEDRMIPNPKRKTLREEARLLAQQIESLQAQLGRAQEDHDEGRPATARGLKIAPAELRRQIAEKRQGLARVENRLRHTPSRISAQQAGKTRALLHEDRRLLVNALKLTAANAERMLALHFDRFYQNPKDAFSIFRGLLQLPGIVRATGPDQIEVLLQRPDSPKVAEALGSLLADLNHEKPRMLNGGPILAFRLLDVNQITPSTDPLL
jgi:transposase